MEIKGIKTKIFKKNDSLTGFIKENVQRLDEGDILVLTSKIVALSEGRTASLIDKQKIILKESKKVIKTPWALLTLNNEGWGINAGVDESNADNELILLPEDPFKSAESLYKDLKKYYSVKNLGILITDTRSVPLRAGTVGRALSFAGFEPFKSYIGKKDMFGRKNRFTESNIADALAASAVFVMGEGMEQIPIVLIKNASLRFTSKIRDKQLVISPEKDIFSFIFRSIKSKQVSKKKPK